MAFVILSSVICHTSRDKTVFKKQIVPLSPCPLLCPRESGTDKLGASRKERDSLLTRNHQFVGM